MIIFRIYLQVNMNNVFNSIIHNQNFNKKIKIILLILSKYNTRCAEILSAKFSDYYPDIHLILKGSKRSSDITIRDSIILELIKELPASKDNLIFSGVSYRTIYSIVKKNYSHLFKKFKTKHNYKVTHGFRYYNAQFVKDSKQLKSVLHHNSEYSGVFYNPKFPKK
jgi:hypothetical protein